MANRKTLTINGVNFSLLTGKQAEALTREYEWAERKGDCYLWHVYGRCSYAKERAYDECDNIRREVGGSAMYIASYNTFQFTLVYTLKYEGKLYVVKETACHRFICEYYF